MILFWITAATFLGRIDSQLTAITLTPGTVNLIEREASNYNITSVAVAPPGTVVNCYIKEVGTDVTPPSPIFTGHPFTKAFTTSGFDVSWYFFFDSSSPNKLNFDVYQRYDVTIECADVNNNLRSAQVVVNVIDNNAPVITDAPTANVTVATGDVNKGDLLYTVTASDPDGDPITYSFGVTPPLDIFSINPATNQIRAKVAFVGIGESPVNLSLVVSDGDKSTQLDIILTITNLNVRPNITNLPTESRIPENTAPGTELLTLLYFDPDQTAPFIPTCTVRPTTQLPVFDIIGSRILVSTGSDGKNRLDYEGVKKYEIDCFITDQYLGSLGPDILTVHIEDVNEKPEFAQKIYTCTLQESPALDSTCSLNLNVKDPEGGAVIISIKPTPDSQRFRFTSPAADRLTFSVNYDIDGNAMPSSLTIDIEATDSAGQFGTAQIQVTVTDRNDNSPVITATQIIDLTPASPVGAVGTVQATDADSGLNGEIEYILTAMNPATTSDYIVLLESGEIQYVKKFPDSLLNSAALLTIQARDKGTPPRSTSDIVTVRFLGDTTQPTNQNGNQGGTAASETRFFDEPVNIAIVTVIGILLFVAVLVAFYFCIKKMLLGYCCGPRKPSNVYPTSQDYGHYDVKKKGYYDRYPKGRGDYPDYHRSDSLYSRDIRSPSVIDYNDNRSMEGNV
ncbi:hypothetical protein SNE40_006054 [Patella caerulea]|uniref:Cadherin domain-containing protein n=1 Tax=Patella caerulea TaxID=87958 RepID=A0AAN8PZF6_PATCE